MHPHPNQQNVCLWNAFGEYACTSSATAPMTAFSREAFTSEEAMPSPLLGAMRRRSPAAVTSASAPPASSSVPVGITEGFSSVAAPTAPMNIMTALHQSGGPAKAASSKGGSTTESFSFNAKKSAMPRQEGSDTIKTHLVIDYPKESFYQKVADPKKGREPEGFCGCSMQNY